MVAIHIHEDNEGMRNLYPAEGFGDALADVRAAREHGERTQAPGGLGWTEMHAIRPPEVGYARLGIRVADMAAALAQHLPRVQRFEVGFGAGNPFHRVGTDPQCYGFGDHLYMKIEEEGPLVGALWFDVFRAAPEEIAALKAAFAAADALCPSAIADYWLNAAGLLSDAVFVERYFGALERTGHDG